MLRGRDKTKRDKVIAKIQDYIVQGTFQPNQKIYSENQLANILGLNRNTIRETLTALELLGIVQSRQGEGTYLTPLNMDSSAKVLSLLLLLEQGDRKDIIQVRRILETAASELSALHRTPEHLKEMESCLQNMHDHSRSAEDKDSSGIAREDTRFHTLIASSTGNDLLKSLINIYAGYINQIASENWKLIRQEGHEYADIIYTHHAGLKNAIRDREPEKARLIMEKHLDFAEQIVKP